MVDQAELFKRQVISNDPSQADIINRSTTLNEDDIQEEKQKKKWNIL